MNPKTIQALLSVFVILMLILFGIALGVLISPHNQPIIDKPDIDLNKLIELQQQAITFNNCVQLIVNDNNTITYLPLWQSIFTKTQVPLGNGVYQNVKVFNNIVCPGGD